MSIQHRPGRPKPYRARLRTPDGRETSRSFERKTDAQAWEREQLTRIQRNEWVDPQAGRILWEEWVPQVLASRGHLAAKTQEDDRLSVARAKDYLGGRAVSAITKPHVRAMVSGLLAAGKSAHTVRTTHKVVRLILEHAVEDRLILTNPAQGVKLPRAVSKTQMRILTAAEVDWIASVIDQRTAKRRDTRYDELDVGYAVLVQLAAYTGMRIGEVAGLRESKLDLLRRRLTIDETIVEVSGRLEWSRGKTVAARRTITLPEFLCLLLAEHLRTRDRGPKGVVFTSPVGDLLRPSDFRARYWRPAIKATIGEPARFHDLRHTHASWLIAAGEHPKAIQQRLGHASITTTMNTYGHLMDGLDDDIAGRLDQQHRDRGKVDVAQTRPKGGADVTEIGEKRRKQASDAG